MFRNMVKHSDQTPAFKPKGRSGKTQDNSAETHFGFRDVKVAEKAGLVRGVFDAVAGRYDIMNDVRLLDVAGGTGDIAFRFLERANQRGLQYPSPKPAAEVIVCDINANMLTVGRNRAAERKLPGQLSWVCGDAERLPVGNHEFDAYTIAFGIRNVTTIENALTEAYRALKPGGRFLCLEFSQVVLPLLKPLYDAYSFNVIPRMGQMITNDGEAYQYLVESIRRFPPQEKFAGMMKAAGFSKVSYQNMTGGVVALHSGWRT
jgi:demethylmenaquinone methyltransferase/2-methoxy-6-polyprenyl-1,4-benzoquinol methylase